MYTKIKHLFFDLDHTLWDFDRNSEKAFETILSHYFPSMKVKSFIAVYVPINQACWKLYQNNLITHEELRYRRLKDTFLKLNVEVSDDLVDVISDEYIAQLPNCNYLFEGCLETLEYLHKKYKLHIITNGFADVQFKKLINSGIADFFDTVTNSEMAGVKKPHPAIYEYALQEANALKEESVMIGDCLDADINGALKFGIQAIFFNPEVKEIKESVKQITNLVALKKIF